MPTVTKAASSHTAVATGWTNPSNAFATTGNNVYATAASVKNGTVSGRFGFPDFTSADIPDFANIDAVRIVVEWLMSASVTGGLLGCLPEVGAAAAGTEVTKTTTAEAQSTATYTAGAITLADLRSASSLVSALIRVTKGSTNTAMTGSLDFARIEVDYTATTPFPPHQGWARGLGASY